MTHAIILVSTMVGIIINILNINNYAYHRGGSEQYFFDLEKMLQQRGHSVFPFSIRDERNTDPKEYFPDGLDLQKPPLINATRFFYSSMARQNIIDVIKRKKVDVVHLHIYHGQLTASILKPLVASGIPIVQTLHDFKLVCSNSVLRSNNHYCQACSGKKHWKSIINRCNKGSYIRSAIYALEAYASEYMGSISSIDQYIAVSDYQKDILASLGVSESKITTIPHCIQVNEEPKVKAEYFLFVGRLVKEKGIYDLINAYSLLDQKISPPLKIVGDGPELSGIQNRLQGSGLKVEILGRKEGVALKELYRNALCLVNPSHYNESFGLTIIEAYACGTPVIVSNRGAMVENVREGLSGYVFQCGDIHALVDKMNFFILQPEKAFLMGLEAAQLAKEKFDPNVHCDSILNVYRKVISQKVSGGTGVT